MSGSKKRVLLGPSSFGALDRRAIELLEKYDIEVVENPFRRKLTKPELMRLLSEKVTGLIAGLETLDREVMEKSELRVISRCGSGMSNVDLEAARELGIEVFSTPFGPTNAVAELTMACLLSLLREVSLADRAMHEKRWEKRIGVELRGKKVTVIGYGRIGKRVGELVEAFGAEVYAVDPAYNGSHGRVRSLSLNEALGLSDIVTVHSSGTECILGRKEFELMKPGVFILNGARGELIDEEALIGFVDNGKVKGAWLDTYAEEPYKGPLCNYEQVILTPHIGSYTAECRRDMELEAAENLVKGFGCGG